jgi:hypothetical protein
MDPPTTNTEKFKKANTVHFDALRPPKEEVEDDPLHDLASYLLETDKSDYSLLDDYTDACRFSYLNLPNRNQMENPITMQCIQQHQFEDQRLNNLTHTQIHSMAIRLYKAYLSSVYEI